MNGYIEKQPASFRKISERIAAGITERSKPNSPHAQLIRGGKNTQLFVPNGSKLYVIDEHTEILINSLLEANDSETLKFQLGVLGFDSDPLIDDISLESPPLHALSLAIAQKCNMGCHYCYAEQGAFGSSPKQMPLDIALKAIDQLLSEKEKGDRVQLSFLGGEPLMNRNDVRSATQYAAKLASSKQIDIGFSITTNGTLVREDDALFFEEYGFAVTVSLDGLKQDHDRNRPLKNQKGSYDLIMGKINPLLATQKRMQVSARVTVTPGNMDIASVLDEFINMGFHSVGFSPLLKAPDGSNEMSKKDLTQLLTGMIECGLKFEAAVLQGRRYPFLNMVNAYKEIAKKTHRPYPCGAGAGYMGVSAEGGIYACHRFVNNPAGVMGNVENGVDLHLQNKWLADRHVHNQQPCSICWARYLCGGGCHYEVIDKGRIACDYIRSWLYFVIQSYERINRLVPNWNS